MGFDKLQATFSQNFEKWTYLDFVLAPSLLLFIIIALPEKCEN